MMKVELKFVGLLKVKDRAAAFFSTVNFRREGIIMRGTNASVMLFFVGCNAFSFLPNI